MDLYSSNYESTILVGGLNSEINDKCMNDFCERYSSRKSRKSFLHRSFFNEFTQQFLKF